MYLGIDVPRKGNVDRNNKHHPAAVYCDKRDVPRKGNVDRNKDGRALTVDEIGRSPQGERG